MGSCQRLTINVEIIKNVYYKLSKISRKAGEFNNKKFKTALKNNKGFEIGQQT